MFVYKIPLVTYMTSFNYLDQVGEVTEKSKVKKNPCSFIIKFGLWKALFR